MKYVSFWQFQNWDCFRFYFLYSKIGNYYAFCGIFDRFFADLRKTHENLKLDGEVLIVGIVVILIFNCGGY